MLGKVYFSQNENIPIGKSAIFLIRNVKFLMGINFYKETSIFIENLKLFIILK